MSKQAAMAIVGIAVGVLLAEILDRSVTLPRLL